MCLEVTLTKIDISIFWIRSPCCALIPDGKLQHKRHKDPPLKWLMPLHDKYCYQTYRTQLVCTVLAGWKPAKFHWQQDCCLMNKIHWQQDCCLMNKIIPLFNYGAQLTIKHIVSDLLLWVKMLACKIRPKPPVGIFFLNSWHPLTMKLMSRTQNVYEFRLTQLDLLVQVGNCVCWPLSRLAAMLSPSI